jgi:hypothetical protein
MWRECFVILQVTVAVVRGAVSMSGMEENRSDTAGADEALGQHDFGSTARRQLAGAAHHDVGNGVELRVAYHEAGPCRGDVFGGTHHLTCKHHRALLLASSMAHYRTHRAEEASK